MQYHQTVITVGKGKNNSKIIALISKMDPFGTYIFFNMAHNQVRQGLPKHKNLYFFDPFGKGSILISQQLKSALEKYFDTIASNQNNNAYASELGGNFFANLKSITKLRKSFLKMNQHPLPFDTQIDNLIQIFSQIHDQIMLPLTKKDDLKMVIRSIFNSIQFGKGVTLLGETEGIMDEIHLLTFFSAQNIIVNIQKNGLDNSVIVNSVKIKSANNHSSIPENSHIFQPENIAETVKYIAQEYLNELIINSFQISFIEVDGKDRVAGHAHLTDSNIFDFIKIKNEIANMRKMINEDILTNEYKDETIMLISEIFKLMIYFDFKNNRFSDIIFLFDNIRKYLPDCYAHLKTKIDYYYFAKEWLCS